jgi:hypothetical protein
MTKPITIDIIELAALMQRTPDTMRRKWPVLHARHGFPRPLPGLGLVWSRAAITIWIDQDLRNGQVIDEPAANPAITQMSQALALTYAGGRIR